MYKIIIFMFVTCSSVLSPYSHATISTIKKEGIKRESVESVKITFTGIVGVKSVTELLTTLDETNNTYPSLRGIYINSPDGNMNSGYVAYEAIKGTAVPVTTINSVYVASAATPLYCAGKERLAMPLANFILHPASTNAQGSLQPDQLEQLKQSVDDSNRLFRLIYQQCTNFSVKEINNMLYSENNYKELNVAEAINRKMVKKEAKGIVPPYHTTYSVKMIE